MSRIKQIILIHPEKFVCKAFEAFGKKSEIKVYSLECADDFAYLLDELKPELVLIHERAFDQDQEAYISNINTASFKDFIQVLITKSSRDLPNTFKKELLEPIKIDELEDILNGLLAEHH